MQQVNLFSSFRSYLLFVKISMKGVESAGSPRIFAKKNVSYEKYPPGRKVSKPLCTI